MMTTTEQDRLIKHIEKEIAYNQELVGNMEENGTQEGTIQFRNGAIYALNNIRGDILENRIFSIFEYSYKDLMALFMKLYDDNIKRSRTTSDLGYAEQCSGRAFTYHIAYLIMKEHQHAEDSARAIIKGKIKESLVALSDVFPSEDYEEGIEEATDNIDTKLFEKKGAGKL